MQTNQKGLIAHKYIVTHADGTPTDAEAEYFILRLDEKQLDKKHLVACRKAVNALANAVEQYNPILASDLKNRYPIPKSITYTEAELEKLLAEARIEAHAAGVAEEKAKYKAVKEGVKNQVGGQGIVRPFRTDSNIRRINPGIYEGLRAVVRNEQAQENVDNRNACDKIPDQKDTTQKLSNPRPELEKMAQEYGVRIANLGDIIQLVNRVYGGTLPASQDDFI